LDFRLSDELAKTELDTMLVLLPGSQVTPESIDLITELTVFDQYMARSRLCTRLPIVLGPCRHADLNGRIGDRMERVGIRFIGVSKEFLDQPIHPMTVTSCQLAPEFLLVADADGKERMFSVPQPILLLEGRYDIDIHHQKSTRRTESDRLMEAVLNPAPSPSLETGLRQVLFIYSKGDDDPAELMDSRLDYSLLGDEKALTTAENFRTLSGRISDSFTSPLVQEMIEHSYALEHITEYETDIDSGAGRRRSRSRQGRRRSNRFTVRFMSRLLYWRWMRENGWTGRVFPDRSEDNG